MENDLRNYMFSCLTFLPDFKSNPVCFAGTEHSLLVSKDGGENWQDALVSLGSTEPVAITSVLSVPQPDQPPLLIAGIVGGFLRSQDGGQTWQLQPSGTQKYLTAIHFSDAQHGWAAGAQNTILKTADGGQTWTKVDDDLKNWRP